jgi:hypothetical protein
MKKCPNRKEKAMEMKNLAKRGLSDTDIDSAEGALSEPPQKVPRLLVVSAGGGSICGILERVNELGIGRACIGRADRGAP